MRDVSENSEEPHLNGWALLFSSQLIGTPLVQLVPKKSSFHPITFSGLICQLVVNIATHAIQRFIMQRVKVLLNEEKTVSETVEVLDFDYPRHFSR